MIPFMETFFLTNLYHYLATTYGSGSYSDESVNYNGTNVTSDNTGSNNSSSSTSGGGATNSSQGSSSNNTDDNNSQNTDTNTSNNDQTNGSGNSGTNAGTVVPKPIAASSLNIPALSGFILLALVCIVSIIVLARRIAKRKKHVADIANAMNMVQTPPASPTDQSANKPFDDHF